MVHFKRVNCTVYELYLSKAITNKLINKEIGLKGQKYDRNCLTIKLKGMFIKRNT